MSKLVEFYVEPEFMTCGNCKVNYTQTGIGFCQEFKHNVAADKDAFNCERWIPRTVDRSKMRRKACFEEIRKNMKKW